MRKTREEKGITLIALIITIVVLLILAVVAINTVTGDGIIQHATNAKRSYEKAQDEEQDVLSYYGQYLENEGNAGDWIKEETTIKNIKTGQLLKIGDIVNYNPGAGVTDNTLLEYTSDTTKTGASSNQTFNVNQYKESNGNNKKWRVWGVEDGNILLISDDIIGNYSTTQKNGALYGVDEFNSICSIYGYGTGAKKGSARSIKMEDIEKLIGFKESDRSLEKNKLKNSMGKYGDKITYKNENGTITYSMNGESGNLANNYYVSWPEDNAWKTLPEGEKTFEYKGYGFSISKENTDTSIKVDGEIYDLIFKKSDNTSLQFYWGADLHNYTFVEPEDKGVFIYSGVSIIGNISNNPTELGMCATAYGTSESTPDTEPLTFGLRTLLKLDSNTKLTLNSDGVSYDIVVE